MFTSYFSHPEIRKNPLAVSIARYTPRWWGKGRRYIALAPSADLLRRSQNGLSWQEYRREYTAQLDALDALQVYEALKNSILVCYEAPGDLCHRRLVAEWIEKKLGIKVPEL